MIRIAASADLHFGADSAGSLRPALENASNRADLLLLAGDLTKVGLREEAVVLADELRDLDVPVIAVLGNHDYHSGQESAVVRVLERAGIEVLEGTVSVLQVGDATIGVAGTKGFGGGFTGASGSNFGEPEMKAFIEHSMALASSLEGGLRDLCAEDVDLRIALTHYSPIRETLEGEPPEIWPFLGTFLLAEAIDRAGAHLALHGHAHRGRERGQTPGGVPVRNVAQPVIDRACKVYRIDPAMPSAGLQPEDAVAAIGS